MLGAIIGDIVGSHYEFNNTKDYNFELFAEPSSYTDDTVMTMAIAWWLLHEQITLCFLLGTVLILVGMYLCDRRQNVTKV